MRHLWTVVLLAAFAGCNKTRGAEVPAPAPMKAATTTAAASPTAAPKDSVTLEREHYVAQVRQEIAGKETLPASQVFRNIKMLTGVPAGRLLAIMNVGHGKSLGVR